MVNNKRRRRVTYIISNIDKALAFEWVAAQLDRSHIDLSFILLNHGSSVLEDVLYNLGVPTVRVEYNGKKDLLRALWQVRQQLSTWRTQVVHTHLFEASLIGLLAAKSLGISKRILTRHHSTMNYDYYPRGVYYDRLMNAMATDIIAITEVVREVLTDRESVPASKIHLIHHGFDLAAFKHPNPATVESLRIKYSTKEKYPVIGVIARQTALKGIQYIIPAFAQVLAIYPKAKLLLANAQGDYKTEITAFLHQYLPSSSYQEIAFELELSSLYKLFDIYVHTPINSQIEAFGQTYVEALAAGIPSVFTLSGVASEFIRHEENALVVPFENSAAIAQAIERFLADANMRERCRANGQASVAQQFSLDTYLKALEELYTA
ncbi:glycosyltransferase family 4 protein [Hymenobacter jejuensis]|uniref:Glycosyltransferase family 4 protein n=1 Tax=Hymenobacter jejuensis TaxID=2502781 RepID=A0A5B7ZVT7_9BACT|nr:glycosyltransferase family 4 protein [Hymenobacter jejuensis]QDA59344.1 glycosyltransferase family 4 protein [Hymenobacter jejuensis]